MRSSRKGLIFGTVFLGATGLAWLGSEVRWGTINNPVGKFETVSEYLAAGRLPVRVKTSTVDEKTFLITYGPADCWLARPSGAPTYVFDETGKLVKWYLNSSSYSKFQNDWPFYLQKESSMEDLRKLPLSQSGQAGTPQQPSTAN